MNKVYADIMTFKVKCRKCNMIFNPILHSSLDLDLEYSNPYDNESPGHPVMRTRCANPNCKTELHIESP